ncbi:hypothetical protein HYV84_07400 [Candidatus Woesearchaeota archaeon]|nr:hypothetical protein [Candidatus Woesearchaeota archaeon]
MSSDKQPAWIFGIFLALFWFVAILGTISTMPKGILKGTVTLEIINNSSTAKETYSFGKGTVLQLLRTKHAVQLTPQGAISCIDGMCSIPGNWVGSVNGNPLPLGVEGIWLSSGDHVAFQFQNTGDDSS